MSTVEPPLTLTHTSEQADGRPLRFNMRELAGSLGDLGTFLPLVVAMALTTQLDLGLMFIGAGLMNIVTGFYFRQPIPVQPMKAIAAVAIAEGLLAGEIAAAGLLMGVLLVVMATTGLVDQVVRWVPRAVVRGIQLGVGLKLAFKGVQWMWALPGTGFDSWIVIAVVAGAILLLMPMRQPVLLYVFVAGFALAAMAHPDALAAVKLGLPTWQFHWPATDDWLAGLTRGTLPQLPLTLLNSVVAVCALSEDYFPGRGISPRRMAGSVGLMNLICVPICGLPVCHGSGGLAAQYQFGARTGGSVIMLGGGKIIAGLVLGGSLLSLLAVYPRSVLGPMLVVAGLGLAAAGRKGLSASNWFIAAATVAGIFWINTAVGFAIGAGLAAAVAAAGRLTQRQQP